MILSRQARGKHREALKKRDIFSQGRDWSAGALHVHNRKRNRAAYRKSLRFDRNTEMNNNYQDKPQTEMNNCQDKPQTAIRENQ